MVHMNVILNLQKRCTFLSNRYQKKKKKKKKTLFVVDVSINCAA